MKHTSITRQIRSDHELAAMCILLLFNGQEPTPEAIDDWERRFRGRVEYEKSLRRAGEWLRDVAPEIKAEA